MEGLTWGAVAAVIALCCSICSVASFIIGRRRTVKDEGQKEGSLETDIRYIKETIRDTTKSLDTLSIKLDAQDKKREEDYRDMLIELTELKSSYKSLHIRVDELARRMGEYHNH